METEKIINYWLTTAEKDLNVAKSLFDKKHYLHSAFFCHLVMEKVLKALVVKTTKTHAPLTHNLLDLAKKAELKLLPDQSDFLDKLTDFNIEARYPDFKLQAYKKATKSIVQKYLETTQKMFLWIKKMI